MAFDEYFNFFLFTRNNIKVKYNTVSTFSVSMMNSPILSAVNHKNNNNNFVLSFVTS